MILSLFVSPQLYFIIAFIIRKFKGDINKINYIYVCIYSFVVSYNTTFDLYSSLTLFIIQLVLYQEINNKFNITNLVLLGLMLISIQYMFNYHELFIVVGFMFICFNNTPMMCIVCFLFINLYTTVISFEFFTYILLISLLKDKLSLMIFAYIALIFSKTSNLYEILVLGFSLIFVILNKEKTKDEIKTTFINTSLNKQLNNFSLIFDHLSTYYENISMVESNFLKSMSNALKYTSKKSIQNEYDHDYIKNKVISILEGYEIGYEEVSVNVEKDGYIRIKGKLIDFKENDIKEILLPLLNNILPTEMKCNSIKKSWLEFGVINVEFISTPPIYIDAYADSSQMKEPCGDSFSIFNYSYKMYCLISDGMGKGMEANKISKCITHLFQRMIFSNIHEIEAMNCINELLLSDAYATCDILIFDRFRKTVNICKSAANPTYLIRDNEIYAIWGNSLPIGIVSHIDVDQIVVRVEKGDLFIMSSDGVEKEEIMNWMKSHHEANARKEVERFMEILNKKSRADDSTILLAKVI